MNTFTAVKEKPVYEHDCDECWYLGSYEKWQDGKTVLYDLYAHWDEGQKTVIARYGSDGPDYLSGLPFASHEEVLRVAVERAIQYGVIPETVGWPRSGHVLVL